jgi:hypothetical protein
VATNGADSLKKSDLVMLLKHHYKVKVTQSMKVADLKVLFESGVATASGVGDAASEVECVSSEDGDNEDE